MNKEQLQKEWQELIEKYGIEEMQRWFLSFKGYKINREKRDFESIKKDLDEFVIKI